MVLFFRKCGSGSDARSVYAVSSIVVAWHIGWGRVKAFRESVRKVSSYSFEHLLFLGGLAAMAYGVSMVYRPAGVILGGWFALKVALLVSQERGR